MAAITPSLAFSPARFRARAREHAPEVLLYCALRAVGLIVLAAMASHPGHLTALLTKWDGGWYLDVARHGYDTALEHRPDGTLINTNIVFFPLYPFAVALFGTVLGDVPAALLVSLLGGIAAAVAMRCIGEELYDKKTGLLLAALWALVPTAIVESMAYTESLYTAIAAFTVYYLMKQRWIASGVTAMLAGLTHPTGIAAAAAVAICALTTTLRGRRSLRPWLAAAIAPLGALAYVAWVGVALGRWDGFTYMEERGWGSSPSLIGVLRQIKTTLTHHQPLGYVVPVFVLAVTLALAVILTLMRQLGRGYVPLAAFAWTSIALALFIGPVYFHAEARFLMPDFPVLLPLAVPLARLNRYAAVAAVGGCALLSAWYGGYLLTIWTHSP